MAAVAGQGSPATSRAAVVSKVDVATGSTIDLLTVERTVLDVGQVEGDVVVVTEEHDGRISVLRWDPDADRVRWRMVSDVRTAEGGTWSTEWSERVLSVLARRLFSVELDHGQELMPQYVNDFRWLDVQRHDLPGGGTIEWPNAADGEEYAVAATARGAGGEPLYRVTGRPWFPGVDDGTAGDHLLVLAQDG